MPITHLRQSANGNNRIVATPRAPQPIVKPLQAPTPSFDVSKDQMTFLTAGLAQSTLDIFDVSSKGDIQPIDPVQARATVNKAMDALGIDENMKSDPAAVRQVLDTMKLLDFETTYPPMKAFLDAAKSESQDLGPLIIAIREGIVKDHPAVVEFLNKSLEEGWLNASPQIQSSIHQAFILEAMTAAMNNDNGFAKEVNQHLLNKREEYGINTESVVSTFFNVGRATGSMFMAAKTVSVDPAMTFYGLVRDRKGERLSKNEVDALYATGELTYLDKRILTPDEEPRPLEDTHDGLNINIYEAGTTEYRQGFKDNSMSAHALVEAAKADPHRQIFKAGPILPKTMDNEFYQSISSDENYFPTTEFSQEWVSLYETWNMAFIMGELDDLQILYPKLLIPSVLSAEKENYLTSRVLALWLSINTLMFREMDGVEAVAGPANKAEMAKAWGEINKKYAYALAEESAGQNKIEFREGFLEHFSQPEINLLKMISNF